MGLKTVAVVLAAGKSERMGKNKLLLKLGGKRLIDHVLDAVETSQVDEIILVLGNEPWQIVDGLKDRLNRIRIVVNEKYEEGMTSSFQTGLKHVDRADAVLLVLGDQLIVNPKFVKILIEQMERHRDWALIVSPIYEGKKGHPLLFSKELFDEILSLKREEVIRDVVHRHSSMLLTIEAAKWTIMDIDTLKDFMEVVLLFKERVA